MRKSLLVVALLLALPVIASAQDEVPKVEIFGGYSYLRADNATGISQASTMGTTTSVVTQMADRNLNGFSTSFTNNLNSWLGIEAEFSGHFTDTVLNGTTLDRDIYFVTAGPRLSIRRFERFTPFAHIMVGMARQDIQVQNASSTVSTVGSLNQQDSGLAFVVGGGVDLNLSSRLGIRLAQTDYILTRFSNRNGTSTELNQANFRASTGVVLKLGEQ
jgi:opacity protein-like surface antigen